LRLAVKPGRILGRSAVGLIVDPFFAASR